VRALGLAVVLLVVLIAAAVGIARLADDGGSRGKTPAAPAWIGLRLGVLNSGAVVVTGVTPGGPAAEAGLHAGDVITEIESRPVAAPVDVEVAVQALDPGDTVEIAALRGSQAFTVRIKLAATPHRSP
jgi:S1-C subfamily serine protease